MSTLATLVTGLSIGSVTGVGGTIVGSWMARKSQLAALRIQLDADNASRKMSEKKQLYVDFMTQANEIIGALISYPLDQDPQGRQAADAELLRTQKSMHNNAYQIELFCPQSVSGATGEVARYLQDCASKLEFFGESVYDERASQMLLLLAQMAIKADIEKEYPGPETTRTGQNMSKRWLPRDANRSYNIRRGDHNDPARYESDGYHVYPTDGMYVDRDDTQAGG